MEVDKKKLERYIVSHCQYYSNRETQNECTKGKLNRCQLDEWTKNEICVPDCPHFADIPLLGCSFGKCNYVKKEMKKLLPEP